MGTAPAQWFDRLEVSVPDKERGMREAPTMGRLKRTTARS